mgnify:CR=1 FL=1
MKFFVGSSSEEFPQLDCDLPIVVLEARVAIHVNCNFLLLMLTMHARIAPEPLHIMSLWL